MSENNCIQKCCCPKQEQDKESLKLGSTCVVPPGVYKNVNVEINEHCKIVSLTPTDTEEVYLCDPCRNDENSGGADEMDNEE